MILFKSRMKITGCDTINGWSSLSMKGSFPLNCLMRFYHKHGMESREKSCYNMICLINNGFVKVYNNRNTISYMSIEEELYKTYITWLPSIDSLSISLYCFDVVSMDNERIREFIFKLGDLTSITKHDWFFYCYLSNHSGHSNLEPTRCDALCNFIVNFAIFCYCHRVSKDTKWAYEKKSAHWQLFSKFLSSQTWFFLLWVRSYIIHFLSYLVWWCLLNTALKNLMPLYL